ncbi:MAG: YbaK/EbsC family protein [Synergistes sp.]|nr:YbaK/EbsC family protein [Synergistes sp.]
MNNEEYMSVEKVRRALAGTGCASEIRVTDATIFTVADASAAVGAPECEILKSILLSAAHGKFFALALMSGTNRVDTKKIKKLLGVSALTFAQPEVCTEWSGFRPGGVPPIGYPQQPQTFIDADIFSYSTVWAAAGTDHAFFPVTPDELMRITGGIKADIKKD